MIVVISIAIVLGLIILMYLIAYNIIFAKMETPEVKKTLYFYTKPLQPNAEGKFEIDGQLLSRKKVNPVLLRRGVVAGVLLKNKLYIGFASCSKKDQFIKERGRTIARSRALGKSCIKPVTIKADDNLGTKFFEIAKNLATKIKY